MYVLSSRCPIPTPLHQPALHYLSEGPIGSADLRKDVQQLKLPVRRVEVEQRDDEDGRQILPPTILREQQRSTYTTCVEVAGRTLLRAQEARRRERCRRKPPENSPASRPRSTSKASMASTSLCAHPAKAPFNPTPTAQRRSRGRAALSEGLIATSHAFSAPYKGSTGSAAGAHHHLAPPDDCAAAAARAPDLFSCTPGGSIFKQGEKSRDGR